MNYTNTYFPFYTHGTDAMDHLSDIIKRYGTKVLIVGGKTAFEKAKEKIKKAFAKEGSLSYEYLWYGGECSYKNIEIVAENLKAGAYEVVLGVGGGKALDTAKAAADKCGMEIITVLTVAATCAATTAISVTYNDDGTFKDIYFLKKPACHSVIDMDIISKSPARYLWAGIGDTIAKYYELDINQRGQDLTYNDILGRTISSLCAEPLIEYGVKALEDIKEGRTSFEFEQVVLNIIVSTGFVSFLIKERFNGSGGHGVFYGLTLLESIEKYHLHGEVVAYGVLVLLKIDGNEGEFQKLYKFYKESGLPTKLADLDVSLEDEKFDAAMEKAINSPDMNKTPYKVTKEMLVDAIKTLENINY